MKKSISIFASILLFSVVCSIIYSGCKKKDSESCSDGIQNQGETGVDCGGPCAACAAAANVLCNGNGQTTYYPLKANNYWNYSVQGATWEFISGTLNAGSPVYVNKTGATTWKLPFAVRPGCTAAARSSSLRNLPVLCSLLVEE
ncbi:MAG: hypothetical protein EPN85_00015 [Bacteroidetes bacterium]|nr:MAG: hypothetical protein EPN85_00015 [Bacteroidota bacterium]